MSIATPTTFRSYLIFWIGQLVSLLGSSVIHFVVIWWITVVTGDPNLLGLTNFFGMLPLIVLSPIAGVFIDRWNRKLIILISDFMQALITFWLLLVFFFNVEEVFLVILINSLRGVCQAFHFPTIKAIIPIMIPKEKLSRMNAVDYLFSGLVHIAGPAIGAVLNQIFSIHMILWVDIITFFIAVIPLILIKIPHVSESKVKRESFSFLKDLKVGFKVLKEVPGLLILVIFISVINFLGQPFGVLLPLLVNSVHFGDELDLAFIMVLMQIGMISGAVITSLKKDWKNRVFLITGCVLLSVVGYVLSAIAPIGAFYIIGIGGLIRAGTTPLINTNFLTIIQLHVPPEKQGKVMSIVVSLAWAVIPPGSLVAGFLGGAMGIVPLYLTFAGLELLTVILTLSLTNIRQVKYDTVYDVKEVSENSN
ncbi:MAG: MFS transporter [Promethearchaeota archaeon]|nr:MAG: MFS transporter [Candidatus Lokiarchaeota archaeon]